jgi:hypothetical protein
LASASVSLALIEITLANRENHGLCAPPIRLTRPRAQNGCGLTVSSSRHNFGETTEIRQWVFSTVTLDRN